MKLSDVKPAENHNEEKNRRGFLGTGQKCKDGILPSAKRIMVESKEKLMWHL